MWILVCHDKYRLCLKVPGQATEQFTALQVIAALQH